MFSIRKPFLKLLLPLISGSAVYLVFPPLNLYPLAFLMLAPFFIFLLLEKNFWMLILGAFLFRIAHNYFLAPYLFEPALYSQSIFIFLGLPFFLYFLKKINFTPRLIFLAIGILYLIFDYWQAKYTLIPSFITHLGNALGMTPFVGLARLGGLWGPAVFLVLSNILASYLVVRLIFKEKWQFFALAILVIVGGGLITSQLFLKANQAVYNRSQNTLTFAAISVDQFFDLDKTKIDIQIDKIKKRLKNEFAGETIDLIILPEGLFELEVSDLENDSNLQIYKNLARELKTNLLINVSAQKPSGLYNANLLINSSGAVIGEYDKKDLIFAGEYFPAWIEDLTDYKSKYTFGDEANLLTFNGINFATPICFESHLPWRMKDYAARGAEFFVNSSSNRWIEKFGVSGLNRYLAETLSLRRLYSVWLQKPIIINGRRDYAGVILPDGTFDIVDFETSGGYNIYKGRIRI